MDKVTPPPDPFAGLEDRVLPWSQVKVITGLSRTTIWRLQKTGDFPASVQVSPNRVGWWQSQLLQWKLTRTPRRLPPPSRPPAVSPPPTARLLRARPAAGRDPRAEPEQAPAPVTAATPAPPRRRRKAKDCPDQTTFDFGS